MSISRYPIGLEMVVAFEAFRAKLTLISDHRLRFEIEEGPFARSEVVDIQVTPLGNGLFAVSWKEETGATVTQVQDFDRGMIHSHATLPDGRFLRMSGPIAILAGRDRAPDDLPRRNKALVLEAMTSLFQRRDASAVERLYAVDYIQHNPGIPQGRAALEAPQVVVDLFRIADGKLAEHWDVLQDEIPAESAVAGLAMFDPDEARRAPGH